MKHIDALLFDCSARFRTALIALAAAAAFLAAPPVPAQEGDEDDRRATSAERVLEEVLVTGRKRSSAELAQDVPIAVTGFSENQLRAIQALDLKDLSAYTPNVQLRETRTVPGTSAFFIRGVGQGQSIQSLQPAVGVFQDGIYMGVMVGAVLDTFDVDSIEILRGPQGTLFGRNVSGGAVQVRTKRPTDEFEGALRLTGGSEAFTGVAARLNVPFTDSLSSLFAVNFRKADGYLDNSDPASSTIGEMDVFNGRAALAWTPSSGFDATLIAGIYKNRGGGTPSAAAILPPQGGYVGPSTREDYWRTGNNIKGFTDQDIWYVTGEANWETDGGIFTAIAGHRDLSHENYSDGDGSSDDFFKLFAGVEHRQDSLEIRYATAGSERFDLTAGIFLWDSELDATEFRMIAGGALGQAGQGIEDNNAYGAFAEADIFLTEAVSMTLGLRYNYEKKDFEVARLGSGACALDRIDGTFQLGSFDPSNCTIELTDSDSWNNISPRVGLQWDVNEDVMLYGSYSSGYRSGSYNARSDTRTVALTPADEETTDAFELGAKMMLADGRARVNLALFRNYIDDYQEIDQVPTELGVSQQLVNIGEAITQGVELETNFLLNDAWAITAWIAYLDAYYEDLNLTGVDESEWSTWDFVKVPELSYSLSTTYELPVGDWGFANLRIAYSYRDSMAAGFNNEANPNRFASLRELDASVAFDSEDGQWSFILSGKNLTNEESADSRFYVGPYLVEFLNPPRTWTATVQYNF